MTLPKYAKSRIVLRMIPQKDHIRKVANYYIVGRPIPSLNEKSTLNSPDISDPAAL